MMILISFLEYIWNERDGKEERKKRSNEKERDYFDQPYKSLNISHLYIQIYQICMRSKEIRQWQIYGCSSPMMIHKIIYSVDYNWWLKQLDTQLNELTN